VLGQRRAVMIGGVLMMIGHFLLALPGVTAFYAALGAIILGNGLFKPNISTMVGGLYEDKDPRRDSGFSIFYMGINVGATLGSLVCGILGEKVGWHYGFAAAGVGMLLGLVTFWAFKDKLLGKVGLPPKELEQPRAQAAKPAERPTLTKVDMSRITVLCVIIIFAAIFWLGFEQAGGLMNLYTSDNVDRVFFGWEMPASWFQAANGFFIILFSPVFARLWLSLNARGRDPSPILKMSAGLMLEGLGFGLMVMAAQQNAQGQKAAAFLVVLTYLLHTFGELCLSPVGLSLTTKLAPRHLVSALMGVWFLSNFMGNWLAGRVGAQASTYGDGTIFAALAIGAGVFGVILLALSPLLTRMMHGAADTKPLTEVKADPAQDEPAPAKTAVG
jgi:POT family proton-dependent oligopeptide transporter